MAVVDFDYIDKACAGDAQMKAELISLFIDQMTQLEPELSDLLGRGDLQTLARSAHSVKSTALSFGMTDLAAALKKIEMLSKKLLISGGRADVPDTTRALYAEQIEGLPTEIREWIAENESVESLSHLVKFCKLQSDLAIAELTDAGNAV